MATAIFIGLTLIASAIQPDTNLLSMGIEMDSFLALVVAFAFYDIIKLFTGE